MTNPKAVAEPNSKNTSADKETGGQGSPATAAVAAGDIAPKPDAATFSALTQEVPAPEERTGGSTADAEWLQMLATRQDKKPVIAPTKMAVATEIYRRMNGAKGVTRKDIIQKFIDEVELTKAGASTYYQMIKKKGITISKQRVRGVARWLFRKPLSDLGARFLSHPPPRPRGFREQEAATLGVPRRDDGGTHFASDRFASATAILSAADLLAEVLARATIIRAIAANRFRIAASRASKEFSRSRSTPSKTVGIVA